MTKNSPRFEQASMSIIDLLREVNEFPKHILAVVGEHMSDVHPDDYVQEQAPIFIQQMDALYAEKSSRLEDAHAQGDVDTSHRLHNEIQLLHAMLTYFASVAAPIEWLDHPFSWHFRKNFVLVYRKIEPEQTESADDDGENTPPPKPKRTLN